MLLVDNDEDQLRGWGEQRRARADDNLGAPFGDGLPVAVVLGRAETAVKYETFRESALGSGRSAPVWANLASEGLWLAGRERQHRPPRRDRPGLAAAGDSVEKKRLGAAVSEGIQDRISGGLLLGAQVRCMPGWPRAQPLSQSGSGGPPDAIALGQTRRAGESGRQDQR